MRKLILCLSLIGAIDHAEAGQTIVHARPDMNIAMRPLEEAYRCSLSYRSDTEFSKIVESYGGIPKAENFKCVSLHDIDYQILAYQKSVIDKVAVGWVVVSLYDRNTGLKSDTIRVSTHVDRRGTDEAANQALYYAFKDAVESFPYQDGLNQIAKQRATAKR